MLKVYYKDTRVFAQLKLLKTINKDTRTTWFILLCSFLLLVILSKYLKFKVKKILEQETWTWASFWCRYCWPWTVFIKVSSGSCQASKVEQVYNFYTNTWLYHNYLPGTLCFSLAFIMGNSQYLLLLTSKSQPFSH